MRLCGVPPHHGSDNIDLTETNPGTAAIPELDIGLSEPESLPILVITQRENRASAVNSILRNRGLAARCTRIDDAAAVDEVAGNFRRIIDLWSRATVAA